MKSEKTMKGTVMIRAVLAAAFACALAFAFALCLPTAKAFAETSVANNVGTVQDANDNANATDANKMSGGAEGDDNLADSEKDGDKDDPKNADPVDVGETQQNGAQGPAEQPAQVGEPKDMGAPAGGNGQQGATDSENLSPENTGTRLVTNAVDDPQAKAEEGATDGASSDSNEDAIVAQDANIPENWYESFEVIQNDSDLTITLKFLNTNDADIYVGKTAKIGDSTYTTVIDNYRDNEDNWQLAFINVGSGTIKTITFEEGVKVLSAHALFMGLEQLTAVNVSALDLSACTDMSSMFNGCKALETLDVSGWDTKACTNMNSMFYECSLLEEVKGIAGWNTRNVTDMHAMFQNCSSLSNLDVSNWDTRSVSDMSNMFDNCKLLSTLDVSKWDTGSVTTMQSMFSGCESLSALDVSKWDTSRVTDMSNMFSGCESLSALDVSKWGTGCVTTMSGMFSGCKSLSALDVSDWDVSKVKSFKQAFSGLPGTTVLDVRKWNANSVELVDDGFGNMIYMGWAQAFSGPLMIVSDGQMANRVESGKNRADGKYIGIDYYGHYGIFLEDSMDRVWCLNMGIEPPSGNLYTSHIEQLDETGLQRLSTVFSAADTQMDKKERWEKIAAAITFFGNVLDTDVQETLQYTIWYYSDNLRAPKGVKQDSLDEDSQAKVKAMVDYVEANWQSLDYSTLKINFYDSGTNPIEPNKDGTFDGKYQNLISLSTAASVKHKGAGKLVITKEIATGSDKDTTQVFTFTVKLKNPDGTPYVMFVQVASEGEQLHTVAPSQDGVITLTIIGEGKAIIENLRPGTIYEIVEESVKGWSLIAKSGDTGTIAENATSEAVFINSEEGKESTKVKAESGKVSKKAAKAKNKSQNNATSTKGTSEAGALAKTGDALPVWLIAMLAALSFAVLVIAMSAQRFAKERN